LRRIITRDNNLLLLGACSNRVGPSTVSTLGYSLLVGEMSLVGVNRLEMQLSLIVKGRLLVEVLLP